jgi:FdhE protein
MSRAVADLEALARTDVSVAPLARLQAVALEAADDPAWDAGVPDLAGATLGTNDDGAPLLHDQTLTVDAGRQRALLHRLAATLVSGGSETANALEGLFASGDFEPLALLTASLAQDSATIEDLAARSGVDGAVLAVVAHTASLPLLLACGRHAAGVIESFPWQHGYCPLCAAWPTLAEIRGLARDFVLRCGRCASGWRLVQRGCIFCGRQDQQAQGYFAAELERETRRAVVCDGCHAYLKTIATLGPLSVSDLLLRDLQSLELDVTAMEHGYARPDRPGWDLRVRIEAATVHDSRGAGGWRSLWR